MPRVHFPSNVETTKSKTQNPFLEIDCRGTELLLKFLNFLGPNEKRSKSSTFDGKLCTLGSLYTLFREYMYNKCLSYVVAVGIGNPPNRLQMGVQSQLRTAMSLPSRTRYSKLHKHTIHIANPGMVHIGIKNKYIPRFNP